MQFDKIPFQWGLQLVLSCQLAKHMLYCRRVWDHRMPVFILLYLDMMLVLDSIICIMLENTYLFPYFEIILTSRLHIFLAGDRYPASQTLVPSRLQ